MRRVSKISRILMVLPIVTILAVPVQARDIDPRGPKDPIVRLIKKWIKTFGDGLILPRP